MIFGPGNFVLLDLDKADASWRWSWFVWDSLSSSELLPGNYPYLTTLYKAAGFYVCLWTSAVWINLTRVGLLAWEHHRYTRRWWNIISSYRTERFHQWTEWFIIMKYFIQLIMETRYLSDQVSKAPKMLHPRFFLLQSWLGFGNNLCLKWGHRWESQSIIQNTPSTSLAEGGHQTRKDKNEWKFPFRTLDPPRLLNGKNDNFGKNSISGWRIGSFLMIFMMNGK